jgi:hypothetical protein
MRLVRFASSICDWLVFRACFPSTSLFSLSANPSPDDCQYLKKCICGVISEVAGWESGAKRWLLFFQPPACTHTHTISR